MFGPALRQLFSDLSDVSDRSAYEEALHRELAVLWQAFGTPDLSAIGAAKFQTTSNLSYNVWIEQSSHPGQRLGEFEVGALGAGARIRFDPLDRGKAETQVDLGQADVKRLRCSYEKCPNKRI